MDLVASTPRASNNATLILTKINCLGHADNACDPTAIVTADHFSRDFEASRHPDDGFQDQSAQAKALEDSQKTSYEKAMSWGKDNRYKIVGGSWVLSMGVALGIVGRSPYLSTSQKLVQARVYAQALTIAVLLASAAFEIGDKGKGEGRWETVKVVDPNDPEHKHLIEKKIHQETYAGEDQWKGKGSIRAFLPGYYPSTNHILSQTWSRPKRTG